MRSRWKKIIYFIWPSERMKEKQEKNCSRDVREMNPNEQERKTQNRQAQRHPFL